MPYSASEFDDIVLSEAEIESVKELKRYRKIRMDKIDDFSELYKKGFLKLANPETIRKDGYGGWVSDNMYELSGKYYAYVKHLRAKNLIEALKLIGEFVP